MAAINCAVAAALAGAAGALPGGIGTGAAWTDDVCAGVVCTGGAAPAGSGGGRVVVPDGSGGGGDAGTGTGGGDWGAGATGAGTRACGAGACGTTGAGRAADIFTETSFSREGVAGAGWEATDGGAGIGG